MRRSGFVLLLIIAAILWYVSLPTRPRTLPPLPTSLAEPLRGAIHVHTQRSDGTGTVDDVAAAASRAGLKFVILTDHGDGRRPPASPQYLHGVLCIDAIEISTEGGHIVALGLPQSPYPLAGEPRDVLEDVARLGGFSIAAHPASEKPELRWTEWTAPFDGLEWINADSEWRDERPMLLVRALFTYPFRPTETLARLLDRPETTLRRWDVLTERRPVVSVAAADAHARIGLRALGEPYDNGPSLHIPTYEAVFRTFSIALPQVQLMGDAPQDARTILNAIRAGHVYSTMDAVGGRGVMTFTARSGEHQIVAGDSLPFTGPVTLSVETQAPADARIVLRKRGDVIASAQGTALEHVAAEPGVYRVEVELPGSPGNPPVPWMLSNPIYVGQKTSAARPVDTRPDAREFANLYENGPASNWDVENSSGSLGAIDSVPAVSGGTELHFRYALSGMASMGPYVAFVTPAGPMISKYNRLMFTARADHPLRLSVQLRVPRQEQGERWHRSVYLDATPRTVTVYFDDLAPRGPTSQRRPPLSEVQSVLFVVDTVNTSVGTNGQIWIDDVKYGR